MADTLRLIHLFISITKNTINRSRILRIPVCTANGEGHLVINDSFEPVCGCHSIDNAISPETNGETEIARDRIIEALSVTERFKGIVDSRVTLSIGCAHWDPQDPRTIDRLLSDADAEMYEDKRNYHAKEAGNI